MSKVSPQRRAHYKSKKKSDFKAFLMEKIDTFFDCLDVQSASLRDRREVNVRVSQHEGLAQLFEDGLFVQLNEALPDFLFKAFNENKYNRVD
jgi:hypothetical protein